MDTKDIFNLIQNKGLTWTTCLKNPRTAPRRRPDDEEPDDDWSDEDADRAEDRWIAERDSFHK
jgi:hypothetical protein